MDEIGIVILGNLGYRGHERKETYLSTLCSGEGKGNAQMSIVDFVEIKRKGDRRVSVKARSAMPRCLNLSSLFRTKRRLPCRSRWWR